MAIDHATRRDGSVTASRAAMIRAIAETEITLESRAGRDLDTTAVMGRSPATDSANTPVEAAELADARATLTLLGAPDPDAWAIAVGAWRDAADPWSGALAQTHEAEAAARLGAAARASEALRDAYQTAVTLGAGGVIAQDRKSVLAPRVLGCGCRPWAGTPRCLQKRVHSRSAAGELHIRPLDIRTSTVVS